MRRSEGGVSSRGSFLRIHSALLRLRAAPRWWSASRFQSTPTGARATRAKLCCSPSPLPGAKTAQRPNPENGRKSPGPKYCFPTTEMEMSWNVQVPTVRSTARSPQRYSMMRPMKLIPPKLIPTRSSSGPEGPRLRAWALAGTRRAKRIVTILIRVVARMAEVEYGFHRRRCQAMVGGVVFFLLAGLLASCVPPDRPDRLPEPLPDAFLAAFRTESLRVLSPGPGVAYYGLAVEEGPWAIHLLSVDLGLCDLGLQLLPAPKQDGMRGGRSRVTELQGGLGGLLAAVNGDFFTPEGLPLGTEVVGGEVRRVRSRPAFAWRPGFPPWMGTPSTEGDSVLVLGWRLARQGGDGLSQVVGGFPHLLSDGSRVGWG